MKFDILKCHGSGNDFVLIDETERELGLDEPSRVRLVTELCRRGGLIGSDGLLFVQRSGAGADAKMRFFNTDGSEAEMCGNGVRCVGRFVAEKTGKDEVVIETMRRHIPIRRAGELFPGLPAFDVKIGEPSLDPATLPMNARRERHIDAPIPELHPTLRFTALSIPNPHIVAFVDTFEPELIELAERANAAPSGNGPAPEGRSVFPRGVNVSFVKVLGRRSIFVLTYERGVGVTNSCGTAMSASSFVACLLGHCDPGAPIEVYNKGGMVTCLVDGDADAAARAAAPVHLVGNATYVFSAEVGIPSVEAPSAAWSVGEKRPFDAENRQYDLFVRSVAERLDTESFFRIP